MCKNYCTYKSRNHLSLNKVMKKLLVGLIHQILKTLIFLFFDTKKCNCNKAVLVR